MIFKKKNQSDRKKKIPLYYKKWLLGTEGNLSFKSEYFKEKHPA